MSARQRLFFLITIIALLLLVIVGAIYRAGLSRGQRAAEEAAMTREAEATAAAALAVIAAQATPTPTVLVPPTDTPAPTATPLPSDTATPTESPTPTPSFTPTPTWTPTQTWTSTPLPDSLEEWSRNFYEVTLEGLNAISDQEFTPDRAAALLRGITQQQSLRFVPASLYQIPGATWAALLTPRAPDGTIIPALFWRDPNDNNRIHGQLLADQITLLTSRANLSGDLLFANGISQGALQLDNQGRFQILLIEKPGDRARLSALVLIQNQPGDDFGFVWWSATDPLWEMPVVESEVTLTSAEAGRLPIVEVTAPLPLTGPLRQAVNAPTLFVEQPPFARQWAHTTWAPPNAGHRGYHLDRSELRASPLSTLAQAIALLQASRISEAGNLATRYDVLEQAVQLELTQPATWLAFYLDASGNRLVGDAVTPRLRFFDNANRSRTFDALFERDDAGVYRLAGLQLVDDIYADSVLVTPAVPTATPLAVATATPLSVAAVSSSRTVTDVLVLLQSITATVDSTLSGTTQSGAEALAPQVAQLPPTATSTATPSATPRPSATPSPTPSGTPTVTPTPSATGTATITPTPTETDVPLPIPAIVRTEAPLVTGQVINGPSNLRGGPGTEYVSLGGIQAFTDVDLFGMTVTGEWVLVRINRPGDPTDGSVGWVAINLLRWETDLSVLPLFRADGTPLIPFTPTSTVTPGAPTATPTATPLYTPTIGEPSAEEDAIDAAAPLPAAEEIAMLLAGDRIPANPFSPIPATMDDGRDVRIQVDAATIEAWGGLFGAQEVGWLSAPGELLWPGTRVYVLGRAAVDDPGLISAERVRIVAGPAQERVRAQEFEVVAQALGRNALMALVGNRDAPGVFLLNREGTLQQVLAEEQEAFWVSGDEKAGIVLRSPTLPTGAHSFRWLRTDGTGVRVLAQPFHSISGIAGDAYGGLWWIEVPQADLDQWQLWHYDPLTSRVLLRLRASGSLLRPGDAAAQTRIPILLAAQPVEAGNPASVSLLVDSQDKATQRLFQGVYRLTLSNTDAADAAGREGGFSTVDAVEQLLTVESYRGPVSVSPDHSRLAYFVFDAEQPSLTSGLIRPANQLHVLSLRGADAGVHALVYATETRFEFLAPDLAWQGSERIILARSRFAAGETFGLDRFGIVALRLVAGTSQTIGSVETNAYLLPNQQELLDFTTCRHDGAMLMLTQDDSGNRLFERWDGEQPAQPLFRVPVDLGQTFVCWQATAP